MKKQKTKYKKIKKKAMKKFQEEMPNMFESIREEEEETKEKIEHKKMAWVCDKCNRLMISDSREHHQMDVCPCKQTGVDLEYYMCRFMGYPRVLATLKLEKGETWKIARQRRNKNE